MFVPIAPEASVYVVKDASAMFARYNKTGGREVINGFNYVIAFWTVEKSFNHLCWFFF